MNSIVSHYFPGLSPQITERFDHLQSLYLEWNAKINVISRKDMDNFYVHHVLHSLGIAKVISFNPGTLVLDIGTGGGFPGIPLAILFPESEFMLVDSIGKKIKVVEEISKELGVQNVIPLNCRAESIKKSFHFIVSRAVTALPEFVGYTANLIRPGSINSKKNGIFYLKGGNFTDELKDLKLKHKIYDLSDYFLEPFFETKKVVHIYRG
ncbi:MAG: 16S rRNA (guanine(527)-N(7))-methyltransferase RsmG [Bacteroidetes bacterium]|nr:16S rRNA (guanine(527)-N(7))-methyltransferase RsmG [Bacteroidota bacterium]